MFRTARLLAPVIAAATLLAQDHSPAGAASGKLPAGWRSEGDDKSSYEVRAHREKNPSGQSTFCIADRTDEDQYPVMLWQPVAAGAYRGDRVRWSALIKRPDRTQATPRANIALSVQVDTPTETLTTPAEAAPGSVQGWKKVSAIFTVPPEAVGITLILMAEGKGEACVTGLELTPVVDNTPVIRKAELYPQLKPLERTLRLRRYDHAPTAPVNLDFEK